LTKQDGFQKGTICGKLPFINSTKPADTKDCDAHLISFQSHLIENHLTCNFVIIAARTKIIHKEISIALKLNISWNKTVTRGGKGTPRKHALE